MTGLATDSWIIFIWLCLPIVNGYSMVIVVVIVWLLYTNNYSCSFSLMVAYKQQGVPSLPGSYYLFMLPCAYCIVIPSFFFLRCVFPPKFLVVPAVVSALRCTKLTTSFNYKHSIVVMLRFI